MFFCILTRKCMKTHKFHKSFLLHISILLFIATNGFSQYWWSSVKQLAPTQENCTNLHLTYDGFVWEHQVDSSTTAIYYQSLWGGNNSVCLMRTEGVKYTHPFMENGKVFFEANPNGNRDIYVIFIDQAGNQIQPMQELITGPDDVHSFRYIPSKMAWLEGEKLKVASVVQQNPDWHFTFLEITTIDSLACSCPAFYGWSQDVYWIKQLDSFDVIRYSESNMFGWEPPLNIDTAKHIKSLTSPTADVFPLLGCTYTNDSTWYMKDFEPDPNYPIEFIPDVELDKPFDFDVINLGVGCKGKGGFYYENFFQAFTQNVNGYDEIFLNEWDPNNYINFSNLGLNCRNPQLFPGEAIGNCTFNFYITWEVWKDSSWRIYYAKTPITIGSIEEKEDAIISKLHISPNPFKNQLKIQFEIKTTAHVNIDLIDNQSQLMEILISEKCSEGDFSKQFQLQRIHDYAGICFVRIQSGGKSGVQKLIKLNEP